MAVRAPIFYGKVQNGKIKLDNPGRFKEYLSIFEDKRVELVLRNRNTGRSENLNRYYWGVVVKTIADDIGYDPSDLHVVLKKHLNVESTSTMNTKEFTEYLETVRRFAAQKFNINIPDPGQVDF